MGTERAPVSPEEPVAETPTRDGEIDEIGRVDLSAAGLAHLWASRPPGSIAPAAAATIALLEAELEARASVRPVGRGRSRRASWAPESPSRAARVRE